MFCSSTTPKLDHPKRTVCSHRLTLPIGWAVTVRSTVTTSVVVLVAPPGNATVTVCVLAYVVANTVCTLVLGAKVSETVTTGMLPVRVTSPKGAETRTVEPPIYEVKVASEGGAPAAAVSSTLIWMTVVEGSGIKIEEKMDWDVTVDMAAGEMSARRAGGIVFLKHPLSLTCGCSSSLHGIRLGVTIIASPQSNTESHAEADLRAVRA